MGEFCKDDVPRLCDHGLLRNLSRFTRPCNMSESYVSSGRYLTLEHVLRHGSALYPVSFVVRYEFVHEAAATCNRLFKPNSQSSQGMVNGFGSPKSVFFYGRGGSANLNCIYRFEPGPERRLEISINRAHFGGRHCVSRTNFLVNRLACHASPGDTALARLKFSEYPWSGIELARDCLCSNLTEPFVFQSLGSTTVELVFSVTKMNVTEDYNDFFFEGEYKFLPTSDSNGNEQTSSPLSGIGSTPGQACAGHLLTDSPRLTRLEERRLKGTSGEISLRSPPLAPTASMAPINVVSTSLKVLEFLRIDT